MGGHWVGFLPGDEKKKRDNQVDNAYRRYMGGHWVGFLPGDEKREIKVSSFFWYILDFFWDQKSI